MLQSPELVSGHHAGGVLARLDRSAWVAARLLAIIGLLILLGYAVVSLADGALRTLANHPIPAVRDMGGLIAAVAVACCMPLGFLERSNIVIRLCQQFVGPRVAHILDAIAAVAVAGIVGLIAWQVSLYAFKEVAAQDTTFMLFIPVAPFWFAVAAMLVVTALVQCLIAAIEIATCRGIDQNLDSRRRSDP